MIAGVLLCVAGVVWIVQGTGVLHGSSMTGQSSWTAIGAVVTLVGLALLISAWRRRSNRST